ncbi:MAG: purine-binding chemotaxis protein CheW [Oscillospiraceae bacterium]|nr:purine-binding chemotaxis protein CheW [Oscillospiraceae bacterium]
MSEEMLFQKDDLEHALSDNVRESDESKYLIFRYSDILYAMSTDVVVEIFTHVDVTRIPMVPDYIAGVINLRGAVVPIIDFRLMLGRYPEGEPCAIILDINGVTIGILVDTVDRMVDISKSAILPVPPQNEHPMVNGMCTIPGGTSTVMLLDAPALIHMSE